MRNRRPANASLLVAGMMTFVGACGPPDAGSAGDVAIALIEAVNRSDGAAACRLLTPSAVDDLDDRYHEPCEQAVLEPDVVAEIASSTEAVQVLAYGRQAKVRLADDVMFLALSGDTWLVRAAGCTPQDQGPYDCAVEGG